MKYVKFIFAFLLVMPLMVRAKDIVAEDEFTVVGETTKYYKTVSVLNDSQVMSIIAPEVTSFTTEITKEEYDSVDLHDLYHLNESRTVQTDYKILKTSLLNNNTIYRYRVDLTWKNIPKVRSFDIIAIGHYSSVERYGLPVFNQSYCMGNGECYDGMAATIITGVNGTGLVFELPTDSLTNLTQYMYFDVKKSSSTTVKHQTVAGDYAHAVKTITYANAKKLSVNIAGIIHDSSVESYYDTIGAAIVNWEGSW